MNGALIRGSKTTRCRSSGQLSSRLLASGRRVSQDANGACKRAAGKGWAGTTRLAVVRRASAKDQEVDYKQRRKGHCYGCGVPLQTDEAGAVGYVAPEKYEVKRTHRQLDQLLCERCVALTHGQMVPAVEDFVQRQQSHAEASGSSSGDAGGQVLELAGRRLLTPEQLRDQLKAVRERKVLVVLVIDVLDASGSFLNRVRDLVGANPIILVATKVDLLPRGTAMADVHQWLLGMVEGKRVSVVDVLCLSSKHKQGVDEALSSILQSRQGRDVFVLGAANTGKSAFVRTLLQEMSRFSSHHYDPAAAATGRYLPVESAMPGTTLGLVPLKAFKSGGHLFDTPGLHLGHRLPHLLTPGELKRIHPVKKLRPFVAPSPLEIAAGLGEPLEGDTVTATYCWGAVARIDVVTAPPQAVLAFYSPPALQVYSMGLLQADDQVVFESPVAPADSGAAAAEEEVLFGSGSVQQRGGLRVVREATVAVRGGRGAICDIALSGLCGWVTVYAPGGSGDLSLRILAPKGIEAYVRRPLPVPNPVTTARIW